MELLTWDMPPMLIENKLTHKRAIKVDMGAILLLFNLIGMFSDLTSCQRIGESLSAMDSYSSNFHILTRFWSYLLDAPRYTKRIVHMGVDLYR